MSTEDLESCEPQLQLREFEFEEMYTELRRMAARVLRRANRGLIAPHSLTPTEVVAEGFLKMFGTERDDIPVEDRGHLIAYFTTVMRNLLKDRRKAKMADKRGGGALHQPLDEALGEPEPDGLGVVELIDVLEYLAKIDRDTGRVAEFKLLSGAQHDEIAAALNLSVSKVQKEWTFVKGWLQESFPPN